MSDLFPDRAMEHGDKLAWMIETRGWAIEPVAPQPEAVPPMPGYAYTVGLERTFGFPEVVVFGLTPVAASGLAELVVDHLRAGTELPVDAVFVGLLDGEQRCALLPLDPDARRGLCPSATAWYGGDEYRVVQLAWPDRQGWLPWEPGFEHRLRFAQPVVGSLSP